MAYTTEYKAEFAERVDAVKNGLRKKGIKYYTQAVAGIREGVSNKLLHNVMQLQSYDEDALALLEQVAGIRPVAEPVAA